MPKRIAPDHKPPLHLREIERKFLVAALPVAAIRCPSAQLIQGYLCHEAGRGQVRVREIRDERFSGAEYYLTVKRREGMVRDEVNVPLSRESFEALWALTAGRRLQKRRYYIPYRRFVIELDVFAGANSGLIVAEIEFRDEAHACSFVPPAWLGREVTKDPAYRNVALATE